MRKLLTIGEVARLVNMSASQIRFYEKKGLLKPKRVENNEYRLYGYMEIDRLERISLLKDLNLSISDMKHLLGLDEGFEYMKILEGTTLKLQEEISRLTDLQNHVETLKQKYRFHMDEQTEVIDYPIRQLSILHDDVCFDLSEKEVFDFTVYHNINYMSYSHEFYTIQNDDGLTLFCLYNNETNEVKETLDSFVLEKGKYLSFATSVSSYDEVDEAYKAFEIQAEREGYRLVGESIIKEDLNTSIYSLERTYIIFEKRIQEE